MRRHAENVLFKPCQICIVNIFQNHAHKIKYMQRFNKNAKFYQLWILGYNHILIAGMMVDVGYKFIYI